MGAILKQLVGRGDIPIYLHEAFQEGQDEISGRGPLLLDLMRMLKMAIALLPRVFVCIDALDEIPPNNLPELLVSLRAIVQESPKTRIFLTARPHVEGVLQIYFTKAFKILITPNMDDIKSYLEMKLNEDDKLEVMNKDLRTDIMKVILDNMSDTCVGAFGLSILSI